MIENHLFRYGNKFIVESDSQNAKFWVDGSQSSDSTIELIEDHTEVLVGHQILPVGQVVQHITPGLYDKLMIHAVVIPA